MAVLLTGGAGYIGSHTALSILNNGGEVVANIVDLANVDTATSIGTYTMNGGTLTTSGMLVTGRDASRSTHTTQLTRLIHPGNTGIVSLSASGR